MTDVLAARTSDAKAFQSLCQNADVDIITFDYTRKIPFSLRFSTVNAAIQRGIMFEICFDGLLQGKVNLGSTSYGIY